jgi:hypothetical protein
MNLYMFLTYAKAGGMSRAEEEGPRVKEQGAAIKSQRAEDRILLLR